MEEQNLEIRADPAFKIITNRLAEEAGLKLISAEFPQSLTADIVLEVPAGIEEKLENSIFSFLKGYQYAIVDFKGENDKLTLHKFITNLARTALFCLKRPEVPVNKVLNLYVTSNRPDAVLNAANRQHTNAFFSRTKELMWLWRSNVFFQEIAIVVCRDLPNEPRYYDWLIFTPAGSEKWKQIVLTAAQIGRVDILAMIKKLASKEYQDMELNVKEILAQIKIPKGTAHEKAYAEILTNDLSDLAIEEPAMFEELMVDLAEKLPKERLDEIIQVLSEQAKKRNKKNGDNQN